MSHLPKPSNCTLQFMPATVLDVRGAGMFLVVNSAGFTAVANVIHTSARDGLVAVQETAEETLVQCTGVQWMASLGGIFTEELQRPAQRDTGLDRFAQEYQNKPAFEPPTGEQQPIYDESGYSSGASMPSVASNDPDRQRVVPITSEWPGEIDAINSRQRDRDASSLRGNNTLDDALEAA